MCIQESLGADALGLDRSLWRKYMTRPIKDFMKYPRKSKGEMMQGPPPSTHCGSTSSPHHHAGNSSPHHAGTSVHCAGRTSTHDVGTMLSTRCKDPPPHCARLAWLGALLPASCGEVRWPPSPRTMQGGGHPRRLGQLLWFSKWAQACFQALWWRLCCNVTRD